MDDFVNLLFNALRVLNQQALGFAQEVEWEISVSLAGPLYLLQEMGVGAFYGAMASTNYKHGVITYEVGIGLVHHLN